MSQAELLTRREDPGLGLAIPRWVGGLLAALGSAVLITAVGLLWGQRRTAPLERLPLILLAALVPVALFRLARACLHPRAGDWVRAALLGALLYPSAWLGLFCGLVVRARLRLGFWPYPRTGSWLTGDEDYPLDPKVFAAHYDLVWTTKDGALLFIHVGPFLMVMAWWLRGRALLPAVAVFAVSMGAFWVLLLYDPGGFLLWFFD